MPQGEDRRHEVLYAAHRAGVGVGSEVRRAVLEDAPGKHEHRVRFVGEL